VVGYVTIRRSRLPAGSSISQVAAFYSRRLGVRWRLDERIPGNGRDGPVLNFRRGRASISVNLMSKKQRVLELGADHHAY
jgi:hypothetical protein